MTSDSESHLGPKDLELQVRTGEMPRTDDRHSTSIHCASPPAPQSDPPKPTSRALEEIPMAKIQRIALLALVATLFSLAPAWATNWIRIVKMVPASPATFISLSGTSVTCIPQPTTLQAKVTYHLDDPRNARASIEAGGTRSQPPSAEGRFQNYNAPICPSLPPPDATPRCDRYTAGGSPVPLPINSANDGSCWAYLSYLHYAPPAGGATLMALRVSASLDRCPPTTSKNPEVSYCDTLATSPEVPVSYKWIIKSSLAPSPPGSVSRATLRPAIPHVVKLKPQPRPPVPVSESLHTSTLTMHKIGLFPRPRVTTSRAMTAVRLPSGWITIGGTLRAKRPGLRLRLSGGRVLVSKRGANGRISYILLGTSGRVVKRIAALARIRLVGRDTLMLQETTGRLRQMLLGKLAVKH